MQEKAKFHIILLSLTVKIHPLFWYFKTLSQRQCYFVWMGIVVPCYEQKIVCVYLTMPSVVSLYHTEYT
jgi:hypothetical protein